MPFPDIHCHSRCATNIFHLIDDEHARVLEEQWMDGSASTGPSGPGNTSVLQGILVGFFFPFLPFFFWWSEKPPVFWEDGSEQEPTSNVIISYVPTNVYSTTLLTIESQSSEAKCQWLLSSVSSPIFFLVYGASCLRHRDTNPRTFTTAFHLGQLFSAYFEIIIFIFHLNYLLSLHATDTYMFIGMVKIHNTMI